MLGGAFAHHFERCADEVSIVHTAHSSAYQERERTGARLALSTGTCRVMGFVKAAYARPAHDPNLCCVLEPERDQSSQRPDTACIPDPHERRRYCVHAMAVFHSGRLRLGAIRRRANFERRRLLNGGLAESALLNQNL
jgi:hypothetical protein